MTNEKETPKTQIFLSYPSQEKELVERLSAYLEKKGLKTWYAPRNIPLGSNWAKEIPPAIKACTAFVLLFSEKADRSDNILSELTLASDYKKPLFCLKLENIEPKGLAYYLKPKQWLAWLDKREETLEILINSILSLDTAGTEGESTNSESTGDIINLPDSSSSATNETEKFEPIDNASRPKKKRRNNVLLTILAISTGIMGYWWLQQRDIAPSPVGVIGLSSNGTAAQIQAAMKGGTAFNVTLKDGDTPLHKAAASNVDPESIRLLIASGMDIEAKDALGQTPLMRAAESNPNPEVVKTLLENEANISAWSTFDRRSALFLAVSDNPNPEVAKIFLEHELKSESKDSFFRQDILKGEKTFYHLAFSVDSGTPWRGSYRHIGTTVLGVAAMNAGQSDVVRYLISAGCDVNAQCEVGQDEYSMTALMGAVAFSNADTSENIKILLEAGGNVNAQDEIGSTALMEAAWRGTPRMVKTLLEGGADVNIQDNDGKTALMWVAGRIYRTEQQPEILRLLLEAGADINIRDKNGECAIDYARDNKFLKDKQELLDMLTPKPFSFDESQLQNMDPSKIDVLDLARNGTAVQLQTAIKSGVVFNVTLKKDGDTIRDEGNTLLHEAASSNTDPESIRILISQGLNVNARSKSGRTPLMRATRNPNPEIVKVLLENGADITARIEYGDGGDTALSLAAGGNPNPEVVKMLLEAEDYAMRTAIMKGTVSFGHAGVLSGRHCFRTTLLGEAARSGNLDVVKFLLKAGCDVNAQSVDGRTALMDTAAFSSNPKLLEVLLEAGSDIDVKDNWGKTALIEAATNSLEMTELLLSAGANVNIQDGNGKTALMWTWLMAWLPEREAISQALISAGADVNIRDEEGRRAEDFAKDRPAVWELSPDVE